MPTLNPRKPWLVSAAGLIVSSLIAIALALLLSWNVFEVVVLYWIQALIIGVFQRRKIRDMVNFSSRAGNQTVKYVRGRRVMPLRHDTHKGFGIIYGIFWLVEGGILAAMYSSSGGLSLNSSTLLVAVAILFGSHLLSYRNNKSVDEQRPLTIEAVLLMPLFRMLLPLHVFSVVVGFETDYGAAGIFTWMLLKTAVDLGIHLYEHGQQVS